MHRQLQLVVLLILIVECASFLPFAQQACLSPGVVMNAKKGNAMREYKEGDPLSGSEYLLKVYGKKGLLSTLTMQGTIPQTLKKWYRNHDLPIYVIEEKYREGWKIVGSRHGVSQSWVVLEHPFDFTVEIKLSYMVSILQKAQVNRGELVGKYAWIGNTKGGTILPDPNN